jgi:hypothetical protein
MGYYVNHVRHYYQYCCALEVDEASGIKERIGGGRGGARCEENFLVMGLNDYQQAGSSATLNEGECKPVAHRVWDGGRARADHVIEFAEWLSREDICLTRLVHKM